MSDLLNRLFPAVPPPPQKTVREQVGVAVHEEMRWKEGKQPIGEELSTRWRAILSFELRGWNKTDIAEHLGLSLNSVILTTKDERYVAFRQEYLAEMDDEFLCMKPLAFAALKNGLCSADENTALRASEQWYKGASFGGYSKTPESPTTVTAEDVARQLLSISADNVQVNIHNYPAGEEKDE